MGQILIYIGTLLQAVVDTAPWYTVVLVSVLELCVFAVFVAGIMVLGFSLMILTEDLRYTMWEKIRKTFTRLVLKKFTLGVDPALRGTSRTETRVNDTWNTEFLNIPIPSAPSAYDRYPMAYQSPPVYGQLRSGPSDLQRDSLRGAPPESRHRPTQDQNVFYQTVTEKCPSCGEVQTFGALESIVSCVKCCEEFETMVSHNQNNCSSMAGLTLNAFSYSASTA